jgi:hypothetical protein
LEVGLDSTEENGVAGAMAAPEAFERRNAAWIDGAVEGFRQTLKVSVRTGLRFVTRGA